ncbi:AraC family transcriptional regulator [Flavobacterium sp. 9]|uniref:AraC family transcriptional regulator n=1 Tax=Flavobacterium sp. 9 TaxID=2035198 RepID=UPI000C18E460|nr:XylR family transcriptional regulator [Flavobacterium sp. 9]PIF32494.1 AraC family transcriptional regulator [Flavobacterium sp. 9]
MTPKVLLLVNFSEEYGRGLLNGIAKYSRLFGPFNFCRIPIVSGNKKELKNAISWAKTWGANGIIAQIENEQVFEKLLSLDIPIIAQDTNERFIGIPNITGLYKETGQMAASYFIEKGFKNFGFYGFDNIVWSRERCEGFCEKVEEFNFNVHIYQHQKEETPPLWSYKESQLADWLKALPKPIAIMTCDDNQGQHVTEACKAVGINVPEQVSVLGVDNDLSICNLSDPPLSSISLNTEKAGFETAQLLSKMMANKDGIYNDIQVEHLQIITRRSTDFLAVNDKEISKALHFIYYNYKERISVDDVVNATALSRRVLEKRFQLVLKRSILDEINTLRIKQVKQLLIETELSITEISDVCGYTDIKNLSRYFSRHEGVNPLEFRKLKQPK